MIPQADIGILRKLGHLVSLCSVLSVVFGLWVLAGWMFQAVKDVLP